MSYRAIHRVLVLGMLAVTAPVAYAADGELALRPDSKLWLTGSSTMHDYSSKATKLTATFHHEQGTALAKGEAIATLIRNRGVRAIEVSVPVTGLRSGKDGLDKNMFKALQAPKHPVIRFVMSGYEVTEGTKPGELAIRAKGKLSVAGVEKEMAIAATAALEGDVVRMRGRVPLKMTQFGIKPPTMMMGAVRTSDARWRRHGRPLPAPRRPEPRFRAAGAPCRSTRPRRIA